MEVVQTMEIGGPSPSAQVSSQAQVSVLKNELNQKATVTKQVIESAAPPEKSSNKLNIVA